MPPRRSSRWNWKKIALVALIMTGVLPFILLHVLTFGLLMHEPPIRNATVSSLLLTNGLHLRVCTRENPRATTTLVFIHGSPGTADAWHAQFNDSFPEATLISYDRLGYGGSSFGGKYLNLKSQVDALGGLLVARQLTNCILIGHSYGGPVALQVALAFPDRVKGVVLIGGSVDPGQEKVLFIQRLGNFPLVRWCIPSMLSHCNTELLRLKADLLALRPQLGRLQCPVVMLHGVKDPLVPVENVDYLDRELKAAGKENLLTKMVMPDYNHFIPWEHPGDVHKAIEQVEQASRSSSERAIKSASSVN